MSYLGGFQTGLAGAGNYSAQRDRRALDREIYNLDVEKLGELKRSTGVQETQNQQDLDRLVIRSEIQMRENRRADNALKKVRHYVTGVRQYTILTLYTTEQTTNKYTYNKTKQLRHIGIK
jgi:hypothetical protein